MATKSLFKADDTSISNYTKTAKYYSLAFACHQCSIGLNKIGYTSSRSELSYSVQTRAALHVPHVSNTSESTPFQVQ